MPAGLLRQRGTIFSLPNAGHRETFSLPSAGHRETFVSTPRRSANRQPDEEPCSRAVQCSWSLNSGDRRCQLHKIPNVQDHLPKQLPLAGVTADEPDIPTVLDRLLRAGVSPDRASGTLTPERYCSMGSESPTHTNPQHHRPGSCYYHAADLHLPTRLCDHTGEPRALRPGAPGGPVKPRKPLRAVHAHGMRQRKSLVTTGTVQVRSPYRCGASSTIAYLE
jgi:hypothetical protein